MNSVPGFDIQISIDFDKLVKDLGEDVSNFGLDTSPFYDARVVYNSRKPNLLYLIIFYKQNNYLFEKLTSAQKMGLNIFKYIESRKPKETWHKPEILDFSKSQLIEIEEGFIYEQDKKPVILIISNLEILFEGNISEGGYFHLTKNIYQHIDEYLIYSQLGNLESGEKFIHSNKNREGYLGKIRFLLKLTHYMVILDKHKIEIERDVNLIINENNCELTGIEIEQNADILCTLMSFYWQKTIDYSFAQIKVTGTPDYHYMLRYKSIEDSVDNNLDYHLKIQYETIYDFIESLDYEKTKSANKLLVEITMRLIKIKSIDSVSAFMVLYNTIEMIRIFCQKNSISSNKLEITDEYKFTVNKTKTNEYINSKIKDIVEIVDDADKELFLSKTNEKVNPIKKKGLIDQFNILIEYLGLKPDSYKIDFSELVRIRNKIFHGNYPEIDVKPYNSTMKTLIYDLTLKLIQ